MSRLGWVTLLVAACSGSNDNREFEDGRYIAEVILAPTCGAAQCHSTFTQSKGDVFDTLDGMRRSIVRNGLVELDTVQFDPADPNNAVLIQWVTQIDPLGAGIGRMPFDAPMPNSDIDLLKRWITGKQVIRHDGAPCSKSPLVLCQQAEDTCLYGSPSDNVGECVNITYPDPAQGAQCDPRNQKACNGRKLVDCTPDWNFGTQVFETCSVDCIESSDGGSCIP